LDQLTLLHMLRADDVGAGLIMLAGWALSLIPLSLGAKLLLRSRLSERIIALSLTSAVLAAIGGPVYIGITLVNEHRNGHIVQLYQVKDVDDVFVLYRKIISYDDAPSDELYRVIRYKNNGEKFYSNDVIREEMDGNLEVWHHRAGPKLFFVVRGDLQVYDMSADKLIPSGAAIRDQLPSFTGLRKLAAGGDDASLWVEDATGLRYRVDADTLQASRLTPEQAKALPQPQPRLDISSPSRPRGCDDGATLDIEGIKDMPRRDTISIKGQVVPGDGWIKPGFAYDHARGCALQPSKDGGAVLLTDTTLDAPDHALVGVDARGEAAWTLSLGWPQSERFVLFQPVGDQELLIANEAGRLALLNYRDGKIVWEIGRPQLARWWGDGVDLSVREARLDGDTIALWVSEQNVTLHRVRRRLKDGALVSSIGF
jgi:hypothetical protein